MSRPTIQEKFSQERRDTIDAVRQYYLEGLENTADPKVANQTIKDSAPRFRGEARKLIAEAADLGGADNFDGAVQALSGAMKALERARDAKCGIKTEVIPVENGPSILVRDASVGDKDLVRGVEATEIQFLNLIRAGLEVADIEKLPRETKIQLLQQAQVFMTSLGNRDDFSTNLDERIPQEKALAKEFDEAVETRVYSVLRGAGVPNVENKVDIAKDFQNLKTEHYNIATISQVPVGVGKTKPAIVVEVGQRSLTDDQKAEYAKISKPNEKDRPAWFNAMPWWEQELCKRNVEAITDGKHTIGTQLWQLVGMKNTFEKVTLAEGDGADLVEIHAKKHAGTLASISEDKGSRQGIFSQNLGQFQEWIGEGVTPVINTLNSAGMMGRSHDPEIIKQHSAGLVGGNGEYVNTAFNLARVSSGANKLAGLEPLLADISACLKTTVEREQLAATNPLQKANFDTVIANLAPKPVSFFGRVVRAIMHPQEAIIRATENVDYAIDMLQKQHAISDSEADILRNAIDLRKGSDASKDAVFLRREGNASLDTATALGFVIGQINSARSNGGLEALSGIPKRDVMTACASGKDRTGEELEIETTKAVAAHYEKRGHRPDIAKISESLVASGHTAQQAGGVFSCGSAAGCFGTRIDNGWGMGNVANAAVVGIVTKEYHAGRKEGSLEQMQTRLIEYASHGTRDHHHMETVLQNPNIVARFLTAIKLKAVALAIFPTVTQYDREEKHPAKVETDLASKVSANKETTISASRDNSVASSVELGEAQSARSKVVSKIIEDRESRADDRRSFAQKYSRGSGDNSASPVQVM
jgi:hypothetical protein